jgi:hypothetical protein
MFGQRLCCRPSGRENGSWGKRGGGLERLQGAVFMRSKTNYPKSQVVNPPDSITSCTLLKSVWP